MRAQHAAPQPDPQADRVRHSILTHAHTALKRHRATGPLSRGDLVYACKHSPNIQKWATRTTDARRHNNEKVPDPRHTPKHSHFLFLCLLSLAVNDALSRPFPACIAGLNPHYCVGVMCAHASCITGCHLCQHKQLTTLCSTPRF